MPDLLAGSKVVALDTPPVASAVSTPVITNISNTDFQSGSPECGTPFIAPTSGRVKLTVGGGGRADSGSQRVWFEPQVFEGPDNTGTEFLAPGNVSRRYGTGAADTGYVYGDRASILTGLTPGDTYFVRVVHAVSTATGAVADITVRSIIVEPMP